MDKMKAEISYPTSNLMNIVSSIILLSILKMIFYLDVRNWLHTLYYLWKIKSIKMKGSFVLKFLDMIS